MALSRRQKKCIVSRRLRHCSPSDNGVSDEKNGLGDSHMRHVSAYYCMLAVLLLTTALLLPTGCRTTASSGLPKHINTVEVHIFQNKTMYKSVESWLTRDIIDGINADPGVRAVSRNGDATITGEILAIRRETLRDTTYNQPSTVKIIMDVSFSFYDNVKQEYIIESMQLSSAETGASPGIYEVMRGGKSEDGERGAAKQVAVEIVRRTVGMW